MASNDNDDTTPNNGVNWCSRLNLEINYKLVHELHPDCIDQEDGCAKCRYALPRKSKTIDLKQHGLKLITKELEAIVLKKPLIEKLDKIADAYGTSREAALAILIEYHYSDLNKREEAIPH